MPQGGSGAARAPLDQRQLGQINYIHLFQNLPNKREFDIGCLFLDNFFLLSLALSSFSKQPFDVPLLLLGGDVCAAQALICSGGG